VKIYINKERDQVSNLNSLKSEPDGTLCSCQHLFLTNPARAAVDCSLRSQVRVTFGEAAYQDRCADRSALQARCLLSETSWVGESFDSDWIL